MTDGAGGGGIPMNTEALLREALQELVRLKRLKASFEAINCKARGAPGQQRAAMRRAYLEQKPIAWANAEAALAQPPQEPVDEDASKKAAAGSSLAHVAPDADRVVGSVGGEGVSPGNVLLSPALLDEADARRYRWARAHGVLTVPGWSISPVLSLEWDKYIDAAISQEPR